jgi:selenocysteine lyase/cysteine desulfurase
VFIHLLFAKKNIFFLHSIESRDIIKQAINASAEDEIIFCNNPSERLAHLFTNNAQRFIASNEINILTTSSNEHAESKCTVVLFVSHLESYNNLKPWIDVGAQIEKIEKNHDGFLDLVDLEKKLTKYNECEFNVLKIGLFSGVSRLSGILSDDVATTILLHQVIIKIFSKDI